MNFTPDHNQLPPQIKQEDSGTLGAGNPTPRPVADRLAAEALQTRSFTDEDYRSPQPSEPPTAPPQVTQAPQPTSARRSLFTAFLPPRVLHLD